MLFIATCTDKPDSLQLRLDTRPAHLAHLNGLGAKVRAAGALLAAGIAVQVIRGTGTAANNRSKGHGGMITAAWLPLLEVGAWLMPAGGTAQTAAFICYSL